MTDFKPFYESENIKIFEYPNPLCSIVDKSHGCVQVWTPEDAKAIMQSLAAFLNEIPFEFGGYKDAP